MEVAPKIFEPTRAQLREAVKSTVESNEGTPVAAPSAQQLKGSLKVTIEKALPGVPDAESKVGYLTRENDIFENVAGGFAGLNAWFAYGKGPEF